MVAFKRATKAKAKLRLALYGPSGSGKTFSALSIASGMGKRIAVIDSEHGAASKYADRFAFDSCELAKKTVDEYVDALRAARGYDVVIVDSLSHAWRELLDMVDTVANNQRHKGNKWSAWSEATPKQKLLVEELLSHPAHIIATMRADTEWTVDGGDGRKGNPRRIGLKPEQGKGIEYEFDMLVALSPEHVALVEKDRTGKFQDKTIDHPGAELGAELAAWLSDGVDLPAIAAAPVIGAVRAPGGAKSTTRPTVAPTTTSAKSTSSTSKSGPSSSKTQATGDDEAAKEQAQQARTMKLWVAAHVEALTQSLTAALAAKRAGDIAAHNAAVSTIKARVDADMMGVKALAGISDELFEATAHFDTWAEAAACGYDLDETPAQRGMRDKLAQLVAKAKQSN